MGDPSAVSARAVAQAGALCLVAGYVDALGYIQYGSVFAANMTGNTVLLAISAAKSDWERVTTYALTLATFLVGGLVSETMLRILRRPGVPLLLSALPLVAVFATGADGRTALALLALGMGLQGAAVSRFHGANLQTVVITGTLLKLTEAGVDRVLPRAPDTIGPALYLPLFWIAWLTYGLGAVLSYLALETMGPAMILLPIAFILPVAMSTWRPAPT